MTLIEVDETIEVRLDDGKGNTDATIEVWTAYAFAWRKRDEFIRVCWYQGNEIVTVKFFRDLSPLEQEFVQNEIGIRNQERWEAKYEPI